jgi:hypothetical protein
MEALSSASIARLMTMAADEWATWERRANPIICNRPMQWLDIAALVPPPEQWEMDCFVAILELIGDLERNLESLPPNHPFYKPPTPLA